eukprot:TRINITY_DN1151_c0_g1_i1.p1 TRINITY_DN1151_c0_g1~~TRINITY_DN1151_c0_g1_i1.p1  ORF type:complete len:117 (+),score=25.56 TRINITY_DN1151_c0_g1_i1:27-377(+)
MSSSDSDSIIRKKATNPQAASALATAVCTNGPTEKKGDRDAVKDDCKHPKLSLEFREMLKKARAAKKMTQADLAKSMAVGVKSINDFESGLAIPDATLIEKMNRILNIQLPKIVKS